MFVDGRWIDIPSDRIQFRALLGDTGESGGGHWCGSGPEPGGYDPYVPYETICAILPPQAGRLGTTHHNSELRPTGFVATMTWGARVEPITTGPSTGRAPAAMMAGEAQFSSSP